MLANPHYELFNENKILENYDGIKKEENMTAYSSDIADKISKDDLKQKIQDSNLL